MKKLNFLHLKMKNLAENLSLLLYHIIYLNVKKKKPKNLPKQSLQAISVVSKTVLKEALAW